MQRMASSCLYFSTRSLIMVTISIISTITIIIIMTTVLVVGW